MGAMRVTPPFLTLGRRLEPGGSLCTDLWAPEDRVAKCWGWGSGDISQPPFSATWLLSIGVGQGQGQWELPTLGCSHSAGREVLRPLLKFC